MSPLNPQLHLLPHVEMHNRSKNQSVLVSVLEMCRNDVYSLDANTKVYRDGTENFKLGISKGTVMKKQIW